MITYFCVVSLAGIYLSDVYACTKGYFGSNCSRECSPNCKPDPCRHTDGCCTTCDAGWKAFNCTADTLTYIVSFTPKLNKLPILVGVIGGACVLIVGVAIAVFIMRKKSGCTLCQTSVHSLRLGSTPASEENNTENFSSYQELNIPLQENPYQSISR